MTPDDLDIEHPAALTAYLRAANLIGPDEAPAIRVLAGGVSNRTVLVERPAPSAQAWVLKQALAKLRVSVDWFSDRARIHREALGLRWLEQIAPPGSITPLVFEDEPHHLLAMHAVPQPHDNWKTLLLAGRLETDHVDQFARLLAQIHARSHQLRDELAPIFDDRSFFESLRIEPYYRYTAARVPHSADFLHRLIETTLARRFALVHGDYSPKNILVHRGRLILLDHEVIHFGDPAFDLGFALAHLLSKAHHLPARRADFAAAAAQFWSVYRASLGDPPWAADLQPHAARHALACLLARVAGRSPLEYLTQPERQTQQSAVVTLMQSPPQTVHDLSTRFVDQLPTSC